MDRFQPVKAALEALEKGAPPTLKLEFPSKAVVDTAGKHLTPAEATGEPALFAKAGLLDKDARYICLALDPDAPFPSFAFLSPILHGIQTDLVVDVDNEQTEWHRLSSETPPLVVHAKPGPPRASAPHRYVSVLWRQSDGTDDTDTASKIKARLGWGDEPVGLFGRVRFDVNVVVEALGLGEVVAISCFTSSS